MPSRVGLARMPLGRASVIIGRFIAVVIRPSLFYLKIPYGYGLFVRSVAGK